MSRLKVQLCGIALESPLVLASGILGVTASSLARVARAGAGAVTTKSFSLEERSGHPCPTIISFGAGMLNAVGLSHPGVDAAVEELRDYRRRCEVPLFASIFGRTVEEFAVAAGRAAEAEPALIEVNVSCPNVASEFGVPFDSDPKLVGRIAAGVKAAAGRIPVSMKLSANFGCIAALARACEENGADAITAINTVGPGMVIDPNARRPVLSNRVGGVSGPAILPIAVRSVWEVRRAVRLPIIGTGGVRTAEDALQLILAGATAVGLGTAIATEGLGVFAAINRGLEAYLEREGLDSLEPLRGAAHG